MSSAAHQVRRPNQANHEVGTMAIETVEDLVTALHARAASLQAVARAVELAQAARPGWATVAGERVPLLVMAESECLAMVADQAAKLAGVKVEAVTVSVPPESLEAANQAQFQDPE